MHFQLAPSLRLAQTSPLVVPKYKPTGSCASAHIAWRLTVHQAFDSGRPFAWRCQLLPPFLETNTAGLPPGLVRGQTPLPSIGRTQSTFASCGCMVIGKPTSPIDLGIDLPMRFQVSPGRSSL